MERVKRRQFLKVTGTASVISVAGCLGGGGGGSDARVPMDITEWPPEDYESEFNLWNWYDDWVANWAKPQFESEFDVSMSTSGYSSASEWYTQLEAGNDSIDNISATTNWVERSIRNDYLHEIPVDIMPAWGNVMEVVKDQSAYRDGDQVYGVPQDLVLYPLSYNTEFFDSPPDSWGVLWDEDLEGNIMMWDQPTQSCQIAAMYTGQDPMNPSDYQEIEEVLVNQKPLLKAYWGDYEQAMSMLVNEDVVAGPLTMGRTYMGRFQEGAPIDYTAPKEGAILTSDLHVIPTGAPHPIVSLLFTNWATETENAAKLFEEMGYMPAVDVSDELSEQDREFTNWPDEWNLIYQRELDDEVRSKYDEIWTTVKSA